MSYQGHDDDLDDFKIEPDDKPKEMHPAVKIMGAAAVILMAGGGYHLFSMVEQVPIAPPPGQQSMAKQTTTAPLESKTVPDKKETLTPKTEDTPIADTNVITDISTKPLTLIENKPPVETPATREKLPAETSQIVNTTSVPRVPTKEMETAVPQISEKVAAPAPKETNIGTADPLVAEKKVGAPIVKILTMEKNPSTKTALKGEIFPTKTSEVVNAAPISKSATEEIKQDSPQEAQVPTTSTPEDIKPITVPTQKAVVPPAKNLTEAAPNTKKVIESPAPTTITPKAAPKKEYTVQVGTYLYKDSLIDANKRLKSMWLKGYAYRKTVTLPLYSVMVGNFNNAEEPREIVSKIYNDGLEADFEVLGDSLYSISTSKHYIRTEAVKAKNDLILRGYSAWIAESKGKKRAYVLRLEDTYSIKEAKNKITLLKKSGIRAALVKK